jgi:polyphosphate glucokinase
MKVLGVDVGGSGIKGAVVNTKNGRLITDRIRYGTPQPSKPKAVIKTIKKIVADFDYSGSIGVGFPAVVMDGVVRSAANIDDKWIGFPGAKKLTQETGCPVRLINDADVAGFGAGSGMKGVVLILTLGTGIGSALFIDGKLAPNTELGHLFLRNHKVDAEDYTSDRVRTVSSLNWNEWAQRLDQYLHHLELLFSPNVFILGGGVSKKHEKYLPKLTIQTRVMPAQLLNNAGIVGAAMAVVER